MDRKRDMAIVTGYTGFTMGNFSDFCMFVERDLLKRAVWTHELPSLAEEIKKKTEIEWWGLINNKCSEEEKEILLKAKEGWSDEDRRAFIELSEKWSNER